MRIDGDPGLVKVFMMGGGLQAALALLYGAGPSFVYVREPSRPRARGLGSHMLATHMISMEPEFELAARNQHLMVGVRLSASNEAMADFRRWLEAPD